MKTHPSYLFCLAFCVIFIHSPTASHAQNAYIFKVLGVSGAVTKQTVNGNLPVTAGSKLLADETIQIDGSGYCGLMHTSGKGIDVRKTGLYPVNELSKTVLVSNKSSKVSDRYISYVMGQLTKKETEDINQNHRKHMEVTGSVERTSTNHRIKIIAPTASDIQAKTYTLNWTSSSSVAEYVVEIHNLFNENVFKIQTKENSAAIDFRELFSKHGKNLILSIKAVGDPNINSKEYSFKLISESRIAELGLSNEKTNASNMINGMICEEHNLFIDALTFYKEATSQGDIPAYQAAYENLLSQLSGLGK